MRRELGCVVCGERGGDLQEALGEHGRKGLGQMEVLDSELLTEDAVDIALGIEDCHIAFANDDEAIATGNGIVGDTAGGISRDGVTGYDFAIDETKGAIGGDVAIDEVLDGTEVGNNYRRPARSDKHTMSVGLGLRQREYR